MSITLGNRAWWENIGGGWVMIGGGGRYCGGVSIGSMDESTQWQRLRCDEINGENVTAAAVVVWRKRHGSGGWGGGSGGRMAIALRRTQW